MKLHVCNSSTNRYAIILNLYNFKFYRIMINVDVHIYKFSERQMIDLMKHIYLPLLFPSSVNLYQRRSSSMSTWYTNQTVKQSCSRE